MSNRKSNTVRPLPTIRRTSKGYVVPGLAVVEARPWRSWACAKGVAQRIAAKPGEYLPVIRICSCPGVYETTAA